MSNLWHYDNIKEISCKEVQNCFGWGENWKTDRNSKEWQQKTRSGRTAMTMILPEARKRALHTLQTIWGCIQQCV